MTIELVPPDDTEFSGSSSASMTGGAESSRRTSNVVRIVQSRADEHADIPPSIKYLHGGTISAPELRFVRPEMTDTDLSLRLSKQLHDYLESSAGREIVGHFASDVREKAPEMLAILRARLARSEIDWQQFAQFLKRITTGAAYLNEELRFQSYVAFLVVGEKEVKLSAARALASLGDLRAIPYLERVGTGIDDEETKASLFEQLTLLRENLERRTRYLRAAKMLDEWATADDDYDEEAWPEIQEALSSKPLDIREPDN